MELRWDADSSIGKSSSLLSKGFGRRQNKMREEVNLMRPRILIAAGIVLAFLVGAMANGIYSTTTRAFNPADENAIAAARANAPVVHRTHLVQPRTVYVSDAAPVETYSPAPVYRTQTRNKRNLQKEVLIVGGSAGAGAAIGAVAGGKKGAGIGALSGGVAGLVYDLATRNK